MICMVRELAASSSSSSSHDRPYTPQPLFSIRRKIHPPTGGLRHAEPPSRPESEPPRFPRDPNHLSLHGTQIIVATCPSIIRGLNHSSACETPLAPAELVAPKGLISERGFAPAVPPPRHPYDAARAQSNALRFTAAAVFALEKLSASRVFRESREVHGSATLSKPDVSEICSFTPSSPRSPWARV